MKPLSDITVLIVDAGTFVPVADMFGRVAKRTLYYSPWEQEYVNIHRTVIGDGFDTFERVDDFMEPEIIKEVGLAVFPDISYGGLQRYFKSIGIPVWGSMGMSDLELYRTRFLKVIQDLGLPMVNSVVCRGLTELAEHLKGVEDRWVKINRYRDNMETFHWQDWTHGQRDLERLAIEFGPLKEHVIFVVQDTIKDEEDSPVIEIGYDGWSLRGEYPKSSYAGYEQKNELYCGSLLPYDDLPEEVRMVNEKMAPVLESYDYRNFWATEIRVKDGEAFFIDPTARMAGQTQEHLLLTCTNLPEVIWSGANGELIKPEFSHQFAAEATIHYKGEGDGWKTFVVPDSIKDRVKLYRCCYADGAYQFPPHKSDELGVVTGQGDTIEESIQDLNDTFAELGDEPVCIHSDGFMDLIEQIQTAEDEGVEFSDQPVPSPVSVVS